MATRRVTFEKLQRERAKKEKAALKRERRQERKLEMGRDVEGADLVDPDATPPRPPAI